MKFLITAKPELIETMKKDLDEEISKMTSIQKSGRFKLASRIVEPLLKSPMLMQMSYIPAGYDKLELTVNLSAEGFMNKGKIKSMITDRAKSYGEVRVEVVG